MAESYRFKSNSCSSFVTLVSPKVTKGIRHPQNSSTTINQQIHRRNNHFFMESGLKQLRMTFLRIKYRHEFKKENASQFLD